MTLIIENTTNANIAIVDLGITIEANSIYDLSSKDREHLRKSNDLISPLISDDLKLIMDDTVDPVTYYTPEEAVRKIAGIESSINTVTIDKVGKKGENKLWVQSTPRPIIDGKLILTHWAGVSDDIENNVIGGGEKFSLDITSVDENKSLDIEFIKNKGSIYIYEAAINFANAGWGDSLDVCVMVHPTPLVEVAQGPYIIEDFKVKYVGIGGIGTHNFADPTKVYLVPAPAGTGMWDYETTGFTLSPNTSNTGAYNIYTIELPVYRIVNKMPIYGSTTCPLQLKSHDTERLHPGYFLRVIANNESLTDWKVWFNINMFRETTI